MNTNVISRFSIRRTCDLAARLRCLAAHHAGGAGEKTANEAADTLIAQASDLEAIRKYMTVTREEDGRVVVDFDAVAMQEKFREKDALIQQLQRALMFWMPSLGGGNTEAEQRFAADVYLLVGYEGRYEHSAEDLGWIAICQGAGE